MHDPDAEQIENLAEEADLAVSNDAYEHAATSLRRAIEIAERGQRAMSAIPLLRRLFLLDMLDESTARQLVRWHDLLGFPPRTLWHAHLDELTTLRVRWPTPIVNAHFASRGIVFEVGETGGLCWDRGNMELAQLSVTAPGHVAIELPARSLLSDAMAAACLSPLLPFSIEDSLNSGGVEACPAQWITRFAASGRTCVVRGPADFD
jgi:hypothetical protein